MADKPKAQPKYVVKVTGTHLQQPEYFAAAALPALKRRLEHWARTSKTVQLHWLTSPDVLVAQGLVHAGLIQKLRGPVGDEQLKSAVGEWHVVSELDVMAAILKETEAKAKAAGDKEDVKILQQEQARVAEERKHTVSEAGARTLTTKAGIARMRKEMEEADQKLMEEKRRRKLAEASPNAAMHPASPAHGMEGGGSPHGISEETKRLHDEAQARMDKLRASGKVQEISKIDAVVQIIKRGRLDKFVRIREDQDEALDQQDIAFAMTYLLDRGQGIRVGKLVPLKAGWIPTGRKTAPQNQALTHIIQFDKKAQEQLVNEYTPRIKREARTVLSKFGIKTSDPGGEALLEDLIRLGQTRVVEMGGLYKPNFDHFKGFRQTFMDSFSGYAKNAAREYLISIGKLKPKSEEGKLKGHETLYADAEQEQEIQQGTSSRFFDPEDAAVLRDAERVAQSALMPASFAIAEIDQHLAHGNVRRAYAAATGMAMQEAAEAYKEAKLHAVHTERALDQAKLVMATYMPMLGAKVKPQNIPDSVKAMFKKAQDDHFHAEDAVVTERRRHALSETILDIAAEQGATPEEKVESIRRELHDYANQTRLTDQESFALSAYLNLTSKKTNRDAIEKLVDPRRAKASDLPLPALRDQEKTRYLEGARTTGEVARLAAKHGLGAEREWLRDGPFHWKRAVKKLEAMSPAYRSALSSLFSSLAVAASGQRSMFTADEHGTTKVKTVKLKTGPEQQAALASAQARADKISATLNATTTAARERTAAIRRAQEEFMLPLLQKRRWHGDEYLTLDPKHSIRVLTDHYKDLRLKQINLMRKEANERAVAEHRRVHGANSLKKDAVLIAPLPPLEDWTPAMLSQYGGSIVSDARDAARSKWADMVEKTSEAFRKKYARTKEGRRAYEYVTRAAARIKGLQRKLAEAHHDITVHKLGPKLAEEQSRVRGTVGAVVDSMAVNALGMRATVAERAAATPAPAAPEVKQVKATGAQIRALKAKMKTYRDSLKTIRNPSEATVVRQKLRDIAKRIDRIRARAPVVAANEAARANVTRVVHEDPADLRVRRQAYVDAVRANTKPAGGDDVPVRTMTPNEKLLMLEFGDPTVHDKRFPTPAELRGWAKKRAERRAAEPMREIVAEGTYEPMTEEQKTAWKHKRHAWLKQQEKQQRAERAAEAQAGAAAILAPVVLDPGLPPVAADAPAPVAPAPTTPVVPDVASVLTRQMEALAATPETKAALGAMSKKTGKTRKAFHDMMYETLAEMVALRKALEA